MDRSLSNAAAHEHASARKTQISSTRTTYREATIDAGPRPEPEKPIGPLRERRNVNWGIILGRSFRLYELADDTTDPFHCQLSSKNETYSAILTADPTRTFSVRWSQSGRMRIADATNRYDLDFWFLGSDIAPRAGDQRAFQDRFCISLHSIRHVCVDFAP